MVISRGGAAGPMGIAISRLPIVKLERLALFGLVLSFSLTVTYGGISYRGNVIGIYPFYLAAGAVFSMYLTRTISTRRTPRVPGSIVLLVYGFLLSITLALLFSENAARSLSHTLNLYVSFALFLYAYASTDSKLASVLGRALIALALIQATVALLQVLTGTPIGVMSQYLGEFREVEASYFRGVLRPTGTFGSVGRYTQVMALLTAYALALQILRPRPWKIAFILLCMICLLLSLQRIGIIAATLIAATGIFAQWRRGRGSWRLLGAMLAVGALGGLLLGAFGYDDPIRSLGGSLELTRGDQLRIASMRGAFSISTERFFGVGLGNWSETGYPLERVHNAFFLFLGETGWPAALFFLGIGLFTLKEVLKYGVRYSKSALPLTMLIALPITVLFFNVYMSVLSREMLALYCVYFGAGLGMLRRARKGSNGSMEPRATTSGRHA